MIYKGSENISDSMSTHGSNTNGNVTIDITPTIPTTNSGPTQSTIDDDQSALLHGEMYKDPNCCERYCCGSLANMACGYPSGTVRSIIAVICTIAFVCVAIFIVVYYALEGNSNVSLAGAGLLSTVLSGITGYYFGTRSQTSSSDTQRIKKSTGSSGSQ